MMIGAIAGIFDLPTDDAIERRLLTSMKHRTHMQGSAVSDRGKILLSGKQAPPTRIRWGNEHYRIVSDATLYNAGDVRRALLECGHDVVSADDEALLAHAYAQWGEEMPERLDGAFAFAIMCEERETVFFARDHLGVKPLYYARHGTGLLLASEIKTILSYPDFSAELDAVGAAQILLLGPGKAPDSGIFRGIRQLEGGYCATWSGGNLRLRRYWQLTDRVHSDSFEETAEKVRFLLKESVSRQIRDVKVPSTMLSGGLDSSIVSALCNDISDERSAKVHTFSVDYRDNDRYFTPGYFQPNSDGAYIDIMRAFLQSEHRQTVLMPEQLVERIADATIARDLPGMADVDTSLLAFCEQIRPHTDVILSGECADEIFGGYPWYRDSRLREVDTFPWSQTTAERAQFMQPWITSQLDPTEFVASHYRATIERADILPENDALNRRIKELVHLNFSWFMQTLIERGDRMGSASGLEIRMPFCDVKIAQYLYGVPWKMKEHGGMEKGLLRAAMADLLPHEVLYRKKSPFPKTHDPRYENIVSEMLKAVIQDKNAPIFALVRPETLDSLLQQDFTWPWYGQLMRRPQTIVFMLQINFWLEHYSVQIR